MLNRTLKVLNSYLSKTIIAGTSATIDTGGYALYYSGSMQGSGLTKTGAGGFGVKSEEQNPQCHRADDALPRVP